MPNDDDEDTDREREWASRAHDREHAEHRTDRGHYRLDYGVQRFARRDDRFGHDDRRYAHEQWTAGREREGGDEYQYGYGSPDDGASTRAVHGRDREDYGALPRRR